MEMAVPRRLDLYQFADVGTASCSICSKFELNRVVRDEMKWEDSNLRFFFANLHSPLPACSLLPI